MPARQWVGANYDARHVMNSRRCERDRGDEGTVSVNRNYRLHRGSRYDSTKDRSMSPEPPGPRVFSVDIDSARVPSRYRPPTNISKYTGETNPGLWLDDCWRLPTSPAMMPADANLGWQYFMNHE